MKNKLKIILAGSPEFVIPTFSEINKNFDVIALLTKNDQKSGRGLKKKETSVAVWGNKNKILVLKINNNNDIKKKLSKIKFDLLCSFAFGFFFPESILKMGKYGSINIHGSLLPKYRGASPIQYAILNEEKEIGISLIEMISQIDAGKIYFQAKEKINFETNSKQGYKIIAKLAQDNIVNWIKRIVLKDYQLIYQEKNYSLAPKILKSQAEIKTNFTKEEAFRKIKAFNPFPGAFIFLNGKRCKLFNASFENIFNSLIINFINGPLYIFEYQFENKKIKKIIF